MTTNEEIQHFCRNIRLIRVKHRLTQKKMAAILGIGVKTLRRIESGEIPPRLGCNAIFRFHEAFRIPIRLLFTDIDHLI